MFHGVVIYRVQLRKHRKRTGKKNWIYETKYQSPFSIKKEGDIVFRCNFPIDTLPRNSGRTVHCRLLATGDVVMESVDTLKMAKPAESMNARRRRRRMRLFYGLTVDRNVTVQLQHEYDEHHWMSIQCHDGSRFMFGDTERFRTLQPHSFVEVRPLPLCSLLVFSWCFSTLSKNLGTSSQMDCQGQYSTTAVHRDVEVYVIGLWIGQRLHKIGKIVNSEHFSCSTKPQRRHLRLSDDHPHQTSQCWDNMHFVELNELYNISIM